MLQRDGIQVMFVHRSFQEYFSALFTSEYHGERFVSILDKLSERTQDQVIPMLFEMTRDRLDREWILPRLNDVLNEAESLDAETWHRNIGEYMFSGCRCHASLGEEKLNVLTVPLLLRGFKFYYWILPLHGFEKVCMAVFSSLDEAATNFVARELEGISNREQVRQVLTRIGKIEREESPNLNLWLFTLEITYLLSDPKVALALETLRKTLQQVKAAVDKRLSGQESMVELLFQELIPATNPKTRKNTRASKKNA